MKGFGAFTLLMILGVLCVGCHQNQDDDGLQAHQLRALDILESLDKPVSDTSDQ